MKVIDLVIHNGLLIKTFDDTGGKNEKDQNY